MKATHTKEYFEKYRELLFRKYREDCDYEHMLKILLPDFSKLPTEVREKAEQAIIKVYAEKVAATAREELLKKMHVIQDIKSGKGALGYTTAQQEIRAWHDLNEGFEFSCFMLAEFKNKYKIA